MAADMRHAGIHWPANAGGEHPNAETILGMPGVRQGCTIICADSARYWYRQARGASPLVVWRALPRPDRLPAQLGWSPKRVADEVLNLWDEQPHGGAEWLLPLNELQFDKEAGESFPGYREVAQNLSRLCFELRNRVPGVKLMFPAWVPSDDGTYLGQWRESAQDWDAICVHCYGSDETMRSRYQSYRDAFPNTPLFVGEWNANHEGHDERAGLEMWAEIAATDPLFLGAAYFIWETRNAGEEDLSIWGDQDRLALFSNPPGTVEPPAPPPVVLPPPPDPTPVEPATVDPWQYWTPAQLAAVTECPEAAIIDIWPRVVEQLQKCGIDQRAVQAVAAGTIAIETASQFTPVPEIGPDGYSWPD